MKRSDSSNPLMLPSPVAVKVYITTLLHFQALRLHGSAASIAYLRPRIKQRD